MHCCICFNEFTELNNLLCSHTNLFCQGCLDNWGKNRCPYCRQYSKTFSDWKEWILDEVVDERSKNVIQDSIGELTEEEFKFIGQYNPPQERGFVFDNNPRVKEIGRKVDHMGIHSGSSYGWTMRTLQNYSRIYFSN